MRRAPALLLCCVASFAWAQAPTPEPAAAPQPTQPAAPERPALKLKLDNPSSWATTAPAGDREQPGNLPGLGDNARPMPSTPSPTPNRTSPYPSEPKPFY